MTILIIYLVSCQGSFLDKSVSPVLCFIPRLRRVLGLYQVFSKQLMNERFDRLGLPSYLNLTPPPCLIQRDLVSNLAPSH